MAAVGTKTKLGTRFAKGLKYMHVAGGTDVLTVRNALEHYPSRNARKAAKIDDQATPAVAKIAGIADARSNVGAFRSIRPAVPMTSGH